MKLLRKWPLFLVALCFFSCSDATEDPGDIAPRPEPTVEPIPTYIVSTFAGDGAYGSKDGPLMKSSFAYPKGIAADTKGNMYVVDSGTNSIRRISPDGTVSTIVLKVQQLDNPGNLAVDPSGNLFVTSWGKKIMKIAPDGTVTHFAGSGKTGDKNGPGVEASFNGLGGLACDAQGNVYVADRENFQVRKITPDGVVSTVPGTGVITEPGRTYVNFLDPSCVAVDRSGNLFVGHSSGISKVEPNGKVTAFGPQDKFGGQRGEPTNISLDAQGNCYVTVLTRSSVRKVTFDGKFVEVAGTGETGYKDGQGNVAEFYWPQGILSSQDGKSLFVADATNYRIRRIDLK